VYEGIGMKIKRLDMPKPKELMIATNIPVGTVFSGRLGPNSEEIIFLRTYDGIVNLENPVCTWSTLDFPILNYLVLDVELRVIRGRT
jgi:hypothetical protein